MDDPIAEYGGAGVAPTDRTNLYTDARGSIVLRAGATGATPEINSYDEYGQPATTNEGRFQYTGQAWLPELGMYYYKARIYSPRLGRFMQTDPIGYEDQYNLYAYVANDPVNAVDPKGEAIVLLVPVGRFLGGAAIGAGVEVFDQVVFEGKDFDEIDLNDVGIAALAGGLGGPGISNVVQGGVKNAAKEAAAINLGKRAARNAARAGGARRAQRAARQSRRAARDLASARRSTKVEVTAAAAAAITTGAIVEAAQELTPTVTPPEVNGIIVTAKRPSSKSFFDRLLECFGACDGK